MAANKDISIPVNALTNMLKVMRNAVLYLPDESDREEARQLYQEVTESILIQVGNSLDVQAAIESHRSILDDCVKLSDQLRDEATET